MTKNKILALLGIMFMLLPSFLLAAGGEGSDDFVVPFMDVITTWMKGNVGLTIAIIIMVISVIYGAFGGGFGVIGKGFVLSIIVGSVIWIATKAFDIGASFDAHNTITPPTHIQNDTAVVA